MTRELCGAAVMVLWLFAASVVGNEFFRDDFEDGSATDGMPVDWIVPSWVPNGKFRVEDGDLILTASDVPPTLPGYDDSRTEMDFLADGVFVEDLSLRTRIRGLSPGDENDPYYIGVTARDTISRDGVTGSFISAYIGSDGRVGVGFLFDDSVDGPGHNTNYPLVPTGLDFVGEDVNLQLDLQGNQAQLTAWGVSQPKPASPHISVILPGILAESGNVVLWVFPTAADWNKPAAFRFVDVARVPEPSTLGLLVFAGVVFAATVPLPLACRRRGLP